MKSHVNGEADFVLSQTVIFESPILDDLVDIGHFWLILVKGWDVGGTAGGQITTSNKWAKVSNNYNWMR